MVASLSGGPSCAVQTLTTVAGDRLGDHGQPAAGTVVGPAGGSPYGRDASTRRRNMWWSGLSVAPYMVSPAAGSHRQPRRDEARGNPVGIRDCPAAVSGNDRRQQHWTRQRPGKRRPVGGSRRESVPRLCPRVRRPASAPCTPVCGGPTPRGTADGWSASCALVRAARASRRPALASAGPRSSSRGESHDGHRDQPGTTHGAVSAHRHADHPSTRRTPMQVRKRNGDTEPVDVNKIVRAVERCGRRPRRRRPAAGRHQDHQRPVRRRHHRRAGPAVDPDGGGDDRRGAGVLPAGRPAAGGVRRQGGPRPGHRVVQPGGRARPRRGADRRRDRRVRRGQRPQARLRHRRGRRPPVRVLRAAHRLRPLPAAPPHHPAGRRDPAVLAAAGGLRPGPHAGRGDRASTG